MQHSLLEMLKNREKVEVNAMMSTCEDMLRYLEHDAEEEHETNQYYVGMAELFRGFVVIDWLNADVKCKDCKILNKILAY